MPEYIEREKALLAVNRCYHLPKVDIAIKNIPTADVAEVVRCGKCKYFHEYPIVGTNDPSGWGRCTKISMDIDLTINDFCSYGERKDGDINA